jgi:hypothetical protein
MLLGGVLPAGSAFVPKEANLVPDLVQMILDLDRIPTNHVGQQVMIVLVGFWPSETLIIRLSLVEISLQDRAVMMAHQAGGERSLNLFVRFS